MAPIGFAAIGGNGRESFLDASLERELDVAQRDVWGWFNSNGLRASFDDRAGSCWESNDDGGSGGKGLVVVDGGKERKDRREVRRVASKSPADGILKISPWYGVHSSPVGVWIARYWWRLLLASGQRFSQGSGAAGATVGNWRSGERVRMALYSKTLCSTAS